MRVQTRHLHLVSIHRIVSHIVRSKSEPMRLSELAAIAGISPFHFSRIFEAVMGEPLYTFIRRLRLEQAAFRLQNSREKVVGIAIEAGFSNGEAFARSFRTHYGLPPTAFRRLEGADWRLRPGAEVSWSSGDVAFSPPGGSDVEVVARPHIRLATYRFTGHYSDTATRWDEVFAQVAPMLCRDANTRWYSIFHDDFERVPHDRLRADLAITWPEDRPMPPGAHPLCIRPGVYICSRDIISSQNSRERWHKLTEEWLPRNGQRPINVPCLNEYTDWPIPWKEARMRLLLGLEMDLGQP